MGQRVHRGLETHIQIEMETTIEIEESHVRERQNGTEIIYEELMAEKFSQLMKDTNLQIQKV